VRGWVWDLKERGEVGHGVRGTVFGSEAEAGVMNAADSGVLGGKIDTRWTLGVEYERWGEALARHGWHEMATPTQTIHSCICFACSETTCSRIDTLKLYSINIE
jgi:hypothetical protein